MNCKVYTGDCLEVLKTLQKESIDLVVTSPPYWNLRDYRTEPVVFDGQPHCRHKWSIETKSSDLRFRGKNSGVGNHANPEIWNGNGKGYLCSICGAWKGQLGQEPSPELFIKHLLDVFDLVKPILKNTGSVFINLADTYSNSGSNSQTHHASFGKLTESGYKTKGHRAKGLPSKCLCLIPERFALGMIERGWIIRNKIVWHKPNHVPESVKDRLTKSYELIYHFVKQKKYYYNLNGIREPHKESSKERVLRAVSNSHKYAGTPYGGGINKPRPNRRTKILSDQAEIFGSPRARYHREHNTSVSQYQYSERDYLVVNLHPKGKNPGDMWEIPEERADSLKIRTLKTKFDDTGLNASSLTRSRDRYRSEGVPEGHPLGKNPGDLWSITTKPFKGAHFAVFPPDIPRKCIIAACPDNGVVLDPFAGSGTTLKAAKELGRKAIGIELNPEYGKIIQNRLNHDCKVIDSLRMQ